MDYAFATVCYVLMASIYIRKDCPTFWIRFKDDSGKWLSKATRFRKDNPGDRRQAELVARKFSYEEGLKNYDRKKNGGGWEWVVPWLADRYKNKHTLDVYRRYWRHVSAYLVKQSLNSPDLVSYQTALDFRAFRMGQGVGTNTAIHELKFLGVIMGEAVKRGMLLANPISKLGMRRDKPAEKLPWTDEAIHKVMESLWAAPEWLRVTFWLGLYQAARLRQCEVPLDDIDLVRRRITYRKTKGDKPFTQPLDEGIIAPLAKIISDRRKAGAKTLCELPPLPSVEWREFLDMLGLEGLVHHGLRVTWITRAAKSDGKVSVSLAMRFVNHGSTAVHEIYQKLNADDLALVPSAIDLPRGGNDAKQDND